MTGNNVKLDQKAILSVAPDDLEWDTTRGKLVAFRCRLEDKDAPAFNTFSKYRNTLGMTVRDFWLVMGYSASRGYSCEAGCIASTPRPVLESAEMLLGPGGACLFEASWQRYRASLADEAKEDLERKTKLLPSIPSSTDPNPCEAIKCAIFILGEPIEKCKSHCCPHRWKRAGREDRAAREVADRSMSVIDVQTSTGGAG